MALDQLEKKKLIDLLLKYDILQFGNFLTKSARRSPYFFNSGKLCSGEALEQVAALLAQEISKDFDGQETYLFGPAYKGIPLVCMTSSCLAREYKKEAYFSYNRKEQKDHGEKGELVGYPYKGGEPVLIIEDVLTGGTSLRESLLLLKKYKAKVKAAYILIDRQEKGLGEQRAKDELEQEFDFEIKSLLSLSEILLLIPKLRGQEELNKIGWDHKAIRTYQDTFSVSSC